VKDRSPFPKPHTLGNRIVQRVVGMQVLAYRLSGGRLANNMKGAPILLLDHVGRKTGRRRTSPILYLADGESLVIVASRGGSDHVPVWWLNLQARPRTTVQVGRERREVVAREASPDERAALWPRLVAMYSDYAVYEQRTSRHIPVIILTPAGA
jgi:deazaflavin-dependent oxidoreductase (nitroreductase family)